MIYIINTPVLTSYGSFRFSGPIGIDDARTRLEPGGWESAVGHEGAARFLSLLLDLEIPTRRVAITMQAGDAALVLRLRSRLPEGAILDVSQLSGIPHELAWLERTA